MGTVPTRLQDAIPYFLSGYHRREVDLDGTVPDPERIRELLCERVQAAGGRPAVQSGYRRAGACL